MKNEEALTMLKAAAFIMMSVENSKDLKLYIEAFEHIYNYVLKLEKENNELKTKVALSKMPGS